MLCEGHTVLIHMINKWNKTPISGAFSLIKHSEKRPNIYSVKHLRSETCEWLSILKAEHHCNSGLLFFLHLIRGIKVNVRHHDNRAVQQQYFHTNTCPW